MNIKQLEYFVNVAETLNFTKAAARCYISQTAMTQQIRALEEQIGVPLFIRNKHHVELTPAGQVYVREARAIIEHSNEAMLMARMAGEGAAGEINIGYIRGYGSSDLADTLKQFHSVFPGIHINLVRDNSSVLMELLENGSLDMVFSVSLVHEEHRDWEQRYLKSFPVMGVLYEGHRLAKKDFLTYPDLKGEEFIMMEPADRPKDQMEESMLIYNRGGYLPNVVAVEGDPESLLLMISAGLGISILPEYIITPYQRDHRLKILPMEKADGLAETLDFYVTWQKNTINPAVDRFLEILG